MWKIIHNMWKIIHNMWKDFTQYYSFKFSWIVFLIFLFTWDAKEKVGRGDTPFLDKDWPAAAWEPFRFRRLFVGLVVSKHKHLFIKDDIL